MRLKKNPQVAASMSDEEEAQAETDDEAEPCEEEVVEPTLEELHQSAESRAEAAEKEVAYRDAEIQNLQKRSLKEKSELIQYSSMNLSRRMLSVLDDIDRALSNIAEEISEEARPMMEGLQLLRDRVWSELKAAGVCSMESKGQVFDPKHHEAITTVPASDEQPVGTVIEVIETGYMFKEKLLRAAKVVVSS